MQALGLSDFHSELNSVCGKSLCCTVHSKHALNALVLSHYQYSPQSILHSEIIFQLESLGTLFRCTFIYTKRHSRPFTLQSSKMRVSQSFSTSFTPNLFFPTAVSLFLKTVCYSQGGLLSSLLKLSWISIQFIRVAIEEKLSPRKITMKSPSLHKSSLPVLKYS